MDRKFIIIVLAVAAAVFFVRFYLKEGKTEVQPDQAAVEELEAGLEEESNGQQETDAAQEEKETEREAIENTVSEETDFQLAGLNQEILDVLEVEESEVAEAVKSWAEQNGYVRAVGASFYESMWIRFGESKYSIEFKLKIGEGGNGVYLDADQVFTMDYYKKSGTFLIHK